ncbi:unnamed protein product, partial [Polarella glacialis]
ALLFISMAVPCFAAALNKFSTAQLEIREERLKSDILSRSLSLELLADLDSDGDGVDQVEFLCGMLLILDAVSPQTLADILLRFHTLDRDDNGVLNSHDLSSLKQVRWSSPRGPLEPQGAFDSLDSKPALQQQQQQQLRDAAAQLPAPLECQAVACLIGAEVAEGPESTSLSANLVTATLLEDGINWQKLSDELRQENISMEQKITQLDSQLNQSLHDNLTLQRALQQEGIQRQTLVSDLSLAEYRLEMIQNRFTEQERLAREAREREAEAEQRRRAAQRRCDDLQFKLQKSDGHVTEQAARLSKLESDAAALRAWKLAAEAEQQAGAARRSEEVVHAMHELRALREEQQVLRRHVSSHGASRSCGQSQELEFTSELPGAQSFSVSAGLSPPESWSPDLPMLQRDFSGFSTQGTQRRQFQPFLQQTLPAAPKGWNAAADLADWQNAQATLQSFQRRGRFS